MNKMPFGLRCIAFLKIAKGAALAGVSLGIFDLVHRDLNQIAVDFIAFARVSPENHYARILLEKAGLVEPGTLIKAGIATSLFASVLLLEGLGLWFGAWWAEYVVVVSTGLFVPEELWACVQRFSWTKIGVLAVNTAILVYIVRIVWRRYRERRERKRSRHEGGSSRSGQAAPDKGLL